MSERTVLAKYIGVSTKDHLTAAVVALLEYAGTDIEPFERPSMWPYAEDLWTYVCELPEADRLALATRMLTVARSRITPTPPVDEIPDEATP